MYMSKTCPNYTPISLPPTPLTRKSSSRLSETLRRRRITMQSNNHLSHETLGLPNELVIHIFKLASATSRKFCRSLCLASSWTRDLALPYLLTTVVLKDMTSVRSFIQYISRHRDHGLFVRNLWLPFPRTKSETDLDTSIMMSNAYDIREVLRPGPCHRVVNLAVAMGDLELWGDDPSAFASSCFQEGLRVTLHNYDARHSMTRYATMTGDQSAHMADVITHLQFESDGMDIGSCITRGKFPRLTHVAYHIHERPRFFHFAAIFTTPLVLVLVIDRRATTSAASCLALYKELCELKPERLQIYIVWSSHGDAQEQWLEDVEGRDVWDRAIEGTKEWTEMAYMEGRRGFDE
jgi:hypothetical protein